MGKNSRNGDQKQQLETNANMCFKLCKVGLTLIMTSQEDNLTGRQPYWKTTLLEDKLAGRQAHRKMTSQEDNLTG